MKIAILFASIIFMSFVGSANARAVRTNTVPTWYNHCLQLKRIADTIQHEFKQGQSINRAYYAVLHTENPNSSWQPAHDWDKRLLHFIYSHPAARSMMQMPGDRIGNSIIQGCRHEYNIQSIQPAK